MNTISHYLTNLALLLIVITYTMACKSNSEKISQEKKDDQIAVLIDRNEKIRHGKEWDQVQNQYVTFRNKIKADKNDADAKIKLGLIFIQEARVTGEHGHYYPAALKIIDDALEQEKKLSNDQLFLALSTKAGIELSLHQFEKALKTGEQAVKLNTYNAQIYGVLVDAFVELGQYEKAVEMADKMVSIRPDLRSYARVSYLRQIHGDIDGSIEAMKMAVAAGYPPYEETAWARYQLGKLYESYGKYDDAEAQYNQVLVDRPDYPFAIAALGDLAKNRDEFVKAETLYDEAIAVIPEVSFYVNKAEILFNTQRSEQGANLMDEIFVMLEDDEASGHIMDLEYAHIYSDILDDQKKALEHALKEYDKRPLNIDVNTRLATIYLKMDNVEKAKEHFMVARRTNSEDVVLKELEKQLVV